MRPTPPEECGHFYWVNVMARKGRFVVVDDPCKNCGTFERIESTLQCRECNRVRCQARVLRKRDKTPGAWREIYDRADAAAQNKYALSLQRTRTEAERKAKQEARSNGDTYYRSGRVCPKGHVGLRYLATTSCVTCMQEVMRSEERKAYDKAYADKNREKILARSREYGKRNSERMREKAREWAERNKDRVHAIKHNYKSRRKAWEDGGVATRDLQEWQDAQDKACYWCEIECADSYHIDHYYPLSKGGSHTLDNLVISCASCNLRKNAKLPEEFAKEIGKI